MIKFILFICSGNTCRSVIAAEICKQILKERKINKVEVSSAGILAFSGAPASSMTKEVLAEQGINVINHQSKLVSIKDIQSADLILTMTQQQKERIIELVPSNKNKIFLFKNYVGRDGDIEDPVSQGKEKYLDCMQTITELLNLLLEKLIIKIAIGSDHAGFNLKKYLLEFFKGTFYEFCNFGTFDLEPVDYPDLAFKVVSSILKGEFQRGVLICKTGIGMSIAANRFSGIRAALCHNILSAELSRVHNDANVLVLGEKMVDEKLAKEITDVWLQIPFDENTRHKRRIEKIDNLHNC